MYEHVFTEFLVEHYKTPPEHNQINKIHVVWSKVLLGYS